jgi:hypothetical protein
VGRARKRVNGHDTSQVKRIPINFICNTGRQEQQTSSTPGVELGTKTISGFKLEENSISFK